MSQKIEIAKAAHLLGVKRTILQKLIKSGDLHTFEGKVDMEELKTCFPSIALIASAFEAELEFIKKAAYSNRVQDIVLPDKEDLASQLQRVKVKLIVEQQKSIKYLNIVQELLSHLSELRIDSSASEKKMIDELSQWVLIRMNNKL